MIKIDEFRRYLKIDKSVLDEEIVQHPSLLFAVSEALTDAIANRDMLKEVLANTDAELDGEVREDFEKMDTKATEAGVKAGVQTHKRHERAFKAYLDAKTRADVLFGLKEAFQSRGYMLRDLCSLYVANYFERGSVQTTGNSDRVAYETRREALAKRREAR